jgi:hypothetical protein
VVIAANSLNFEAVPSSATLPPVSADSQPAGQHLFWYFQTPRNRFGLSRQFYSKQVPDHDPEKLVALEALSALLNEKNLTVASPSGHSPFYPYPNKSAFCLGDRYWNHGVQKSQQSFKELLSIVSDLDFTPDNIRKTQWSAINTSLATNNFNEGEDDNK